MKKPIEDKVAASVPLRGDFVYRQLRDDLRTGKLVPGSRLLEVEVAARLKVSRTPVREALKRLEADGMASFTEGRGLIVTELGPKQVAKLYAMREIIEAAASRFAAIAATGDDITLIQKIYADSLLVEEASQVEAYNKQFHDAIRAACDNEYIQQTAEKIDDWMHFLAGTVYSLPGRLDSVRWEHEMIVTAIAKRDPDAAEAAMRQHIQISQEFRSELMFGIKMGGTRSEGGARLRGKASGR